MHFLILFFIGFSSFFLSTSWWVCEIKDQCTQDNMGVAVVQAAVEDVGSANEIISEKRNYKNKIKKKVAKKRSLQKQVKKDLRQKKKNTFKIIGNRIHFATATGRIKNSKVVKKYLLGVAKAWKKRPNRTIYIMGHTDNRGKKNVNYKLGLYRAKVIRQLLVKMGVNPRKIKVNSRGEMKPMSSNRTMKGRFLNRRVEVSIR